VRAILSDLDGVLIDSGAVVDDTWRTWASRHGLDADAIVAGCHGRPGAELVAEHAPQADVAAEMEWLERYEIDAAGRVRAFDGAAELLASDLTVAIVTSCTAPLAHARLTATGLRIPDVLVTADRVARGKPAPDPYLLAAEELGVAPADCVVLEDAPAGIEAGRAAGMTVLAVATTHESPALARAHRTHATLRAALAALGLVAEAQALGGRRAAT
jgi:mannitol-1-/sugar-/sorbitol-6-phosphatase